MKDASLKTLRVMSGGGWAATSVLALAVVVCAPFAWRLVRVWWMPAPSAFVATIDSKDRAAQYAGAFDGYVKQLDGRSLFYEPSAPGSVGEVAAEETVEDADPSQPAATRYDGPTIAAMVLDTVWFSDGQRVKAGTKGTGDMEVISTNAPWDAKVKWHGTEFTVPFFERDKVIFKSARAGNTSSASSPSPASLPPKSDPATKDDAAIAQKPTEAPPIPPDTTAAAASPKPEPTPELPTTSPTTEPTAPASGSSPAQAPPAPPSETPR